MPTTTPPRTDDAHRVAVIRSALRRYYLAEDARRRAIPYVLTGKATR